MEARLRGIRPEGAMRVNGNAKEQAGAAHPWKSLLIPLNVALKNDKGQSAKLWVGKTC